MIGNLYLRDRSELVSPVVIIGAGAAGIALALALDARGTPCLLLEAGGDRIDVAGQDIYRAGSISPDDHGPVHRYRRRACGGTTAIWGGRCIPFDPIDLEDRDWIPHAEWPIRYEEVSRYFRSALDLCRAGAASFHAGGALPDVPPSMIGDVLHPDVVLDRIEMFSEPTHFGKAYRRRLERSRTTTIVTDAAVAEIITSANGREVRGVAVRMLGGGIVRVRAGIVVVAAGGLESARLLLCSRSAKACGLGNERDMVGRFYQSHLEGHLGEIQISASSAARFDYERSPEGIYCRRYLWLSPEAQRREGLAGLVFRPTHAKVANPAHRDPILSAMYLAKDLLLPEYARGLNSTEHAEMRGVGRSAGVYLGHIRNILLGSPRLSAFAADWMRRRIMARRKLPSVFLENPGGRYPLDINAEQTPNPDSRVLLSSKVDITGMPRLDIRWQTTAQDLAMVARGFQLIERAIATSAGTRILADKEKVAEQIAGLTRVGGHHVGTVRMGMSAQTGVVDANCEAFDVAGLYVAGSATFPTSGFANPTLMIVALAMRMAERIADVVEGRAVAGSGRTRHMLEPIPSPVVEEMAA